jgi:hypothetical protein
MSLPDSPPPPPPAAAGEPAGLPWERRAEAGGAVRAFVETLRRLAVEPAAAFVDARRRGELVSPLSYAVLLAWLGVLAERMWSLVVGTSLVDFMPPEMRDATALGFALSGIGLAIALVVVPVVVLLGLVVYGAVVHLFLMLYGATRDSPAGYEGTLRALAWSSTAQLGQLVPFAGGLVVAVWGVVLQTMALAAFHRTTPGRALAAVLTPLALCCVCFAVFFAGIAALVVGGLASGAGGGP